MAALASSTDSRTPRERATRAEAAEHADFSTIRYAQCWEDADVLLAALQPRPGQVGLSIASAGDNTLALLASGPERVFAIDLNPAQLACLELRVAAYRTLTHRELLVLMGSEPGTNRSELYRRCRLLLSPDARWFWDRQGAEIDRGIGGAGKFERYFALFRRRILPLVHSRPVIARMLAGGTRDEREAFYRDTWDTWRWRAMFRMFFSRTVMGRFGRDPSFFRYVEGDVAGRILNRTRHALTALDPAENPYIQWILTGRHASALPYALRPGSFDVIRQHLDRLEWRCVSAEAFLTEAAGASIDWFNLSDIFEYVSGDRFRDLLVAACRSARSGSRLAYWNTLVPRSRPDALAGMLRPLNDVSSRLHAIDKAFFYSAFVVEEVI
jgi:S-adenosylmethionine:diacylglycerol 3-amino-3-carboxypropyl transferase